MADVTAAASTTPLIAPSDEVPMLATVNDSFSPALTPTCKDVLKPPSSRDLLLNVVVETMRSISNFS